MTPQLLLEERLDGLLRRLDGAERLIDDPALESVLRPRIAPQLKGRLAGQRDRIGDALSALQRHREGTLGWALLQGLEKHCAILLHECLAYVHSVLARRADADSGLCVVADSLLDELSDACELGWRRFTILADDE